MKTFKIGLVVGKFSPLHKGHESLIRAAQESCEVLLLLTYSRPEFKGCEAARRAAWLKALFPETRILALDKDLPDNDAPADIHREFVAQICRERFKILPDAVFTMEDYGPGFAAYLEKSFGKPVEHVFAGPPRTESSVSGTLLRSDIHKHRNYMSQRVYADFIQTVCFLGAESTGKSTLAEIMAKSFDTAHVPEYGRTLWEQKKGFLEFDDLLTIAQTHIRHEEEKRFVSNRYLFVDTSPLTTLFYSQALFNRADPELERLADRHYDHIFYCYPDFPLVQDGTRADENFRQGQHGWYLNEIQKRNLKVSVLRGTLEQKIRAIAQVLQRANEG